MHLPSLVRSLQFSSFVVGENQTPGLCLSFCLHSCWLSSESVSPLLPFYFLPPVSPGSWLAWLIPSPTAHSCYSLRIQKWSEAFQNQSSYIILQPRPSCPSNWARDKTVVHGLSHSLKTCYLCPLHSFSYCKVTMTKPPFLEIHSC